MSADLVLTSGKVITMNPSQPYAEAIAIKHDKIVQVGTNEAVKPWIGKNTQVISLKGKPVVPGFIDTHIHVADFGRLLTWIDLNGAASIKEMQERLSRRVAKAPKGKWLLGRGWNQTRFAEKRLPTRFDLDAVSPDNLVIFYHQNGQVCLVNSKALELAGVTQQTAVPAGGSIDRDAKGELTGVLRDNATNLIWKFIPEPSEEELMEAAGLACEKIVEAGVTSVHWMVLSETELSVIQSLLARNRLPLRVYVIIPLNLLDAAAGDSAVKVDGVEISADGYLAAKTAALSQPYLDGSEASGKLLCTQDELNAAAAKILQMNFQLIIHAMGDKAVGAALNAIDQASMKASSRKNARSRIEQAAVLNKELISRLKKQQVIVSVQPCVVASEFSVYSAVEKLGAERARWLFPIKTLLEEGVRVVGGSDCPMEPLNPLLGMQAAVTREVFPEERVTVEEALRMYTVDAAYLSNEENVKGSVETGKLADLAVLSRDPFSVPPSEIASISVEMTIVSGKVVYSKP